MAQTITGVMLVPVHPGNDYAVGGLYGRPVLGLPAGQTVVSATLVLKRYVNDAVPLVGFPAKSVTSAYVPGVGLIVNPGAPAPDGSGTWTAAIRFDLPAAQTALLLGGLRYEYHIDVLTSAGFIFTAEMGYLPTISA